MATVSDAKTTQAEEEEEEDFSSLTAKDVELICPEGMDAKLKTLHEVRKKALFLQLELDGKIYSGCLIEAIDSFAPVNLTSSERRCTTGYKTSKVQHSDVTKQKKPNVYSRKNYPKGYVDVHNTIEARLRFGRDRRNSGSRTLSTERSSNSKKDTALIKSNRKTKSLCSDGVENSTSNDSYFCNSQKKNRYSRKLTDESFSEATTSNENSFSSCYVSETPRASGFYKDAQSKVMNEERGTTLSDTSLYSPKSKTECVCAHCEFQISITPISTENTAMIQFSPDQLGTGPDLITFSPEINSETLSKNHDDAVDHVSSTHVSSCQLSEPDLITFSPRTNTEILSKSNDEVFQSPSRDRISQIQSLKPKLSATLRTNERAKDLLDSSDVECAASGKTISPQCPQNKLELCAKKVDGIQLINQNNKLPMQETNYQFPDSQMENATREKEMLSVSDYTTVKNVQKADSHSPLTSKFQYNWRNIIEIQCLDGLNNLETATLGEAMFHQLKEESSLEKHNETNVMPFTHPKSSTSKKSNRQQFDSKVISQSEDDTRDISNESSDERSSDSCCKSISRNTCGKETEKSDNFDKALENTGCSVVISAHLPASGDGVKQLENSDVVIVAPHFGPSCQSSECDLPPSTKGSENLIQHG